jgi:hypothetical protein
MKWACVKNWAEFQHYKDRSPPWIKLHRALLDDFDFQCLPVASRALAPMLWLLAAEHSAGLVCIEPERIAFRLRMTPKEAAQAVTPLIEKGFLITASDLLADCKQPAIPETEIETETEKAIESAKADSHASADADPPSAEGFQPIIDAYHAALPKCLHISVLNPKRKRRLGAVRKLAKQVCEQQGWPYDEPAFFGAYWAECAEDPWMRGEVVNPNNPAWKQNLDVLLAEDRFAGVMDRVIERMRGEA